MSNLGFSFSLAQLWQVCGGQILLIIAGLALIIADILLLGRDKSSRTGIIGWITIGSLVAIVLHVMFRQWNVEQTGIGGIFSADRFTTFLCAVVIMSGILAALMSLGYLKNNKLPHSEYFILLIFAVYGTVAFIQSVDLLMMFITLEIMSIAVYALAAFIKACRQSQEGAFKYFMLGSFGSAFFLFGMALLYGFTGTVNLSQIAKAISVGGLFHQPAILLALAMLMIGLFFKMAMVPFHMWTPDVYEGSPSVVTGFMATAVKAAAFGVFIKVLFVAFSPLLSTQSGFSATASLVGLEAYWKPVVWWAALLTMFIGNLLAVSQKNVKRMLAYSSVAHAGYMALGILAANAEGRAGILFYLFSYTLMNLGAFGVLYIIDGVERGAQTLGDYKGIGFKYPGLAFLMSLFLVAMAGLPPTAGFIAKFYVFSAAIKEGYMLLAALGIMTSVFGLYYYLRVIWMMYMEEPERDVRAGTLTAPTLVAIVVAAIGVIYLGILPEGLATIASAAQAGLAVVF